MAAKYQIAGPDVDYQNALNNLSKIQANLGTNDVQLLNLSDPNQASQLTPGTNTIILGNPIGQGLLPSDYNYGSSKYIYGADRGATLNSLLGIKDYNNQASNAIDPQIALQKSILEAAAGQKNAALEGQKAYTTQNYDLQKQEAQLNTEQARNRYSNNTVSRGLPWSTITTSGLAGITNTGNRVLGNLGIAESNALNDIAGQQAAVNSGLADEVSTLDLNKLAQIAAMAQQLQQQDYTNNYNETGRQHDWDMQDKQWQEQLKNDAFNQSEQLKADQLAAAKAASGGSGGGSGGSGSSYQYPSSNNTYTLPDGSTIDQQGIKYLQILSDLNSLTPDQALEYLVYQHPSEAVAAMGTAAYQNMIKKYKDLIKYNGGE